MPDEKDIVQNENVESNPKDISVSTKSALSEEELQKRIEAARKDEKEKLYPQIKKLAEENDKKSSELQTLQEQLANVSSKFTKISEAFVDKPEPTPEEKARATFDDIQKMREDLLNQKAAFEQEIKQAKLDLFKEKKMAEYGNELIAELVVGNSEAEIEASVQKANETYTKMKEKFAQELAQTEKERKKTTKLPPNRVPSSEPSGELEIDENANKVKNMSLDEYEKQRETFIKMVKDRL